MNNNKLIHYLNSGVKVEWKEHVSNGISISEMTLFNFQSVLNGNGVPFLYPLSCLTETIIHNGKEEIPLVELAKIDGFSCEDDEYVIRDNKIFVGNSSFTYRANSFFHKGNSEVWGSEYLPILNQLLLFDYCYSRRINIWEIDAIDPRTLEVNPYKILNYGKDNKSRIHSCSKGN